VTAVVVALEATELLRERSAAAINKFNENKRDIRGQKFTEDLLSVGNTSNKSSAEFEFGGLTASSELFVELVAGDDGVEIELVNMTNGQ